MSKIVVSIIISMLFIGCSLTNQQSVTYEKYSSKKEFNTLHVNNTKVVKKQNIPTSGSIKGNITNLEFSNGLWKYFVKGTDVSNQKLSMAKFTHTQRVANEGDLVYAVLKNGKLKEWFLIKQGNYKKKIITNKYKKIKKEEPKTYKRTKNRQILGVPSAEEISLD